MQNNSNLNGPADVNNVIRHKTSSNSNVETDEAKSAWQTVIHKRKDVSTNATEHPSAKRISRDPRLENKNPDVGKTYTQNRFSALEMEADTNEETVKVVKPPPIFLTAEISDFTGMCKLLNEVVSPTGYLCTTTTKGIRINPTTPTDFRTIVAFLKQQGATYYTYQLTEDKPFRVVIRGLHPSIEAGQITEDLTSKGFSVRSVTNVISREKVPLPLFFIDLERTANVEGIYSLGQMLFTKIKVEEPRRNRHVSQCHRCQQYGHTRHYCTLPPRCVRCGDGHFSNECTKTRLEPAKCALCKENHPSSYKGCMAYRDLQNRRAPRRPYVGRAPAPQVANRNEQEPLYTNENFPQLPNQTQDVRNNATRPGLSYARAATRNIEDQPANNVTDISRQLSSFLSEMRGLLTPIINLMTQLLNRI